MDGINYAAFVVDLDGTLIGRDERVSPRVAEMVGKLAAVLPVTIASERETSDVLAFASQLGLTAPQVSDNGAMILEPSTGKPIWRIPLAEENASMVLDELPLLGACGLGIAMGNAPEELKAMADYVAPPLDRDGLADAIERFILPSL